MKVFSLSFLILAGLWITPGVLWGQDLQKELQGHLSEKKRLLKELEARRWKARDCIDHIETVVQTLWDIKRLRAEIEIDERFIEEGFNASRYDFQKAQYLETLIEQFRGFPILTILRTVEGRDCDDVSPIFKHLQIKIKHAEIERLEKELSGLP